MHSTGSTLVVLVLAGLALIALMNLAERSMQRENARVRARAAAEMQRTDYPLVYEWGPNMKSWGPSYRVVIREDSFTSDLAGVRFAAPIASIWKVDKVHVQKSPGYWRVLCHAEAPEP